MIKNVFDGRTARNFWNKTELLLNEIEKVINEGAEELRKKHTYNWSPNDPFVVKKLNNIYIPKIDIEYKLFYLGYERELIDIYLDLFRKIRKENNSLISEFSLRTLYEIAFPKVQLIFDKTLDPKIRDKYRLLVVLADYCYLAYGNKKYLIDFNKLINSEKNQLLDNMKLGKKEITYLDFFNLVIEAIRLNKQKKHIRLCRVARRLITDYQSRYFRNKTKILKCFNEKSIDTLYWSYSHLLHGNLLLLIDLFAEKRAAKRGKLKITWALLLTGINVAYFLIFYLENKKSLKKVKDILNEFNDVKKTVSGFYQTLEK